MMSRTRCLVHIYSYICTRQPVHVMVIAYRHMDACSTKKHSKRVADSYHDPQYNTVCWSYTRFRNYASLVSRVFEQEHSRCAQHQWKFTTSISNKILSFVKKAIIALLIRSNYDSTLSKPFIWYFCQHIKKKLSDIRMYLQIKCIFV